MNKIIQFSGVILAAVVLSGCGSTATVVNSNPAASAMANANFLKTADGGASWAPKEKIDDKTTIASADVLSMAINPLDSNNILLGTASNGILETKDGAETWIKIPFPGSVYGLVLDPQNPQMIYATGVLNKRGKIYKRDNEQAEWKEIYTEPSDGTFVSALAIDQTNPQVLYAGTNAGVILKSTNGGQQWINLQTQGAATNATDGTIASITFDAANPAQIYFAVFQKGLLKTKDAGATLEDITKNLTASDVKGSVFSALADPYLSGTLYVGTDNGILKSVDGGQKWQVLNIIASSKPFPIRTIAINPKNSRELIYSAAKAIYKSLDSGAQWSTFQLDTAKNVSVLQYDPNDPSKIYAGLRKM